MDPMARALELAGRALGRTAPNPPVGAVLVRDGAIVGEGFHVAAGRPHAEAVALAQAGARARGATLFVTLEPCAHEGRTPPCTDAIIAAGISEVRYAIGDPDPRVSGRGARFLEAAGGEHAAEASELLRGYLQRTRTGRPWVTAKYAMSLDGKTATRTGEARWISGETSRRHVHMLRDRADAVVVGIGTVLADDPALTVRPAPPDGRQPLRVVADSRLRLPPEAALAGPALAPGTAVAHVGDDSDPAVRARAERLRERGLELLALPADRDGRIDLACLLAELGRRALNQVLVEGGGELLAGLVGAGLVDEIEACVAPVLIGGANAPTPIRGRGTDRLIDAPRWSIVGVTTRPPDVWLTVRPSGATEAVDV
jgi:diaminohydroxyphosphoribosylaminopyrimidine deaminase/5-amino-6-(5-phosphoribosylamino)uracil reductase